MMISSIKYYVYLVCLLVTTLEAVQACKVGENCTEDFKDSGVTHIEGRNSESLNENSRTAAEHGCVLDIPENLLAFAYNDPLSQITNGAVVNNSIIVSYKCSNRDVLIGSPTNACLDGTWASPIPECSRTCSPKPLQGITFTALCKYKGLTVDCNGIIRPGTQATIACAIGYRDSDSKPAINVVRCEDTGEWDYYPSSCEAICGEKPISVVSFFGEPTKSNAPWLVAIYKQAKDDPLLICGGTIISAKVVVTAATCFPGHDGQARDPQKYLVVSGKNHRNFNAIEPMKTQITNISDVIIPEHYMAEVFFYRFDIALLVLENPIEFKSHISPICLEWQANHSPIVSGIVGKLEGWGRLTEHSNYSEIRKSIRLKTYSDEDCLKTVSASYKSFIGGDKFCAGPEDNEITACQGDSGGGLAVQKLVGGVPKFFLLGVLSASLSHKTCDPGFNVVLTNIQYHKQFITEYLTKFKSN